MKIEHWKSSLSKLKSTKWLALMALMLALRIVVSRFSIPVGVNLNVSLSFVLVAISGMMFGPTAALVFAAAEDILEFILFPSGYGFFAGYTLSAMLGALTYALFLYDQRITVLKIVISKFITSFAINVVIGSCWTWILTGKSQAYLYYAGRSLIKNGVLFPIQIVILVLLLNLLIPFLSRKKLIQSQKAPIPFI